MERKGGSNDEYNGKSRVTRVTVVGKYGYVVIQAPAAIRATGL